MTVITLRIHSIDGTDYGTLTATPEGGVRARPNGERGRDALEGLLRGFRDGQSAPAFLHHLSRRLPGRAVLERDDWRPDPHGHAALTLAWDGTPEATLSLDGGRLRVDPAGGKAERPVRDTLESLRRPHWSDEDLFAALPELLTGRLRAEPAAAPGPGRYAADSLGQLGAQARVSARGSPLGVHSPMPDPAPRPLSGPLIRSSSGPVSMPPRPQGMDGNVTDSRMPPGYLHNHALAAGVRAALQGYDQEATAHAWGYGGKFRGGPGAHPLGHLPVFEHAAIHAFPDGGVHVRPVFGQRDISHNDLYGQQFPLETDEGVRVDGEPTTRVLIHDDPVFRGLLRQMRDSPDDSRRDPAPYQMLADWLGERGHPAAGAVASARNLRDVVAALSDWRGDSPEPARHAAGHPERYAGWAEPPQPWEARARTGEPSYMVYPPPPPLPERKPTVTPPPSYDPAEVPAGHTHVVDLSAVPPEHHAAIHAALAHLGRVRGIAGGYLLPPDQPLSPDHPAAGAARRLTQDLRRRAAEAIAAYRASHVVHAPGASKLPGLSPAPGVPGVYEVPGGRDVAAELGGGSDVRHLFGTEPPPGASKHVVSGEPPSLSSHARPVHPMADLAATKWTRAEGLASLVDRPAHRTAPRPMKVGPVRLAADEAGVSSLPLLYNDRLPPLPKGAGLADIAHYLHRRTLRALGGHPLDWSSPRTREATLRKVARVMAAEAIAAVGRNGSAVKWYKQSLRSAKAVAALLHPELARDPVADMAFTAALAITSNGNSVGANALDADAAYRLYKQNGRMPEDYGKGPSAGAMRKSFRIYNLLAESFGPRRLRDFLLGEMPAGELQELGKEMGFAISGENTDAPVVGAMVFGPKIGNGFFSNLMGDWSRLTMDRWFMRTFNRYTGELVRESPEKVEAAVQRFRRAMWQSGEKSLAATLDDAALFEAARSQFNLYQRGGFKDRSELNRAAKGLMETLFKPNEAPGGGSHRQFMRDAAAEALRAVHAAGIGDVETADLQALLWYPEKDLYEKLGYDVARAKRLSYDEAFRQIARDAGVGRDEVRRAVEAAGGEWSSRDDAAWNETIDLRKREPTEEGEDDGE